MIYTNRCLECGLVEDEQRPMSDYKTPSPCTACGGETECFITGTKIKPFADGPNNGRMK